MGLITHTHAHTQSGLPFAVPDVVVLTIRDGRVRARWPVHDLIMTFESWAWALERLPVVCACLGVPLVLRVRPR